VCSPTISPSHSNDNPIGVSAQLGVAPRRFRRDAEAIVIEAHQATLRHRDFHLVVAVESDAVRGSALRSTSKTSQTVLSPLLGSVLSRAWARQRASSQR